MRVRALILTYHAVEEGAGPLYITPDLLVAHLDAIAASGARVVNVSELASALREGSLDAPTVCITFDDGAASVARVAAPLLAERGLHATVFCVAGHLGGRSNWPSARPCPTFELATAKELAELFASGWEIGAHGMTHAPLDSGSARALTREIVGAKELLEDAVDAPVWAHAYPYGAMPSSAARRLVEATYQSAWTTRVGYVRSGVDLYAGRRVDIHYVARTQLLSAALKESLGPYLGARRLGAQARRALRREYRTGRGRA